MAEHLFEPGGDDSTYGKRGMWCQHGEGSEEGPCGKTAAEHPTVTPASPSLEQLQALMGPVMGDLVSEATFAELASRIHALYTVPRSRIRAVEAARAEATDRAQAAENRIAELESLPRVDMYEPEDGLAEIDGVLWIPSAELDAVRKEEGAAAAAQKDRLEALRRSHEFIAVQEPETRVSASLLLSAVRWVLTGQVDD